MLGYPLEDLLNTQAVVVWYGQVLDALALDEALGVVNLVTQVPERHRLHWRLVSLNNLREEVVAFLLGLEPSSKLGHRYSNVLSVTHWRVIGRKDSKLKMIKST